MNKKTLLSLTAILFAASAANAGALGQRLQNLSKNQNVKMSTLQVILGGIDATLAKKLLSVAISLKYDKDQVDALKNQRKILESKLDEHTKISQILNSDASSSSAAKELISNDTATLSQELADVNGKIAEVERGMIEHGAKSGVRLVSGAAGLFFVYELGDRAYSVIITNTDPGLFPVIASSVDKSEDVITTVRDALRSMNQ